MLYLIFLCSAFFQLLYRLIVFIIFNFNLNFLDECCFIHAVSCFIVIKSIPLNFTSVIIEVNLFQIFIVIAIVMID